MLKHIHLAAHFNRLMMLFNIVLSCCWNDNTHAERA